MRARNIRPRLIVLMLVFPPLRLVNDPCNLRLEHQCCVCVCDHSEEQSLLVSFLISAHLLTIFFRHRICRDCPNFSYLLSLLPFHRLVQLNTDEYIFSNMNISGSFVYSEANNPTRPVNKQLHEPRTYDTPLLGACASLMCGSQVN